MRRQFLKTIATAPIMLTLGSMLTHTGWGAQQKPKRLGGPKLKMSLNAYSFNEPLRSGAMSLDDLLEFCATVGFDGVDLTGYYFPGYPAVPPNDVIYHIRQKAFLLGLDISGTGVRNDFTESEAAKRERDVRLVKEWILVASKLGAPVIRIFAGKQTPEGFSRDQISAWMVKDIRRCVAFGREHGVMVAIQNHNDFIRTAEDALSILRLVDDPWFGLILDTGSFRGDDPYGEIEKTAGHAVNWQVKEQVYRGERQEKADLKRLVTIIRESGYRGYLPIETLGEGEPKTKVARLFADLQDALE